jgi:SAM-dependent methyltransferase
MSGGPQSNHYGPEYDYLNESPHLKHRHLYEGLTSRIASAIESSDPAGSRPEVLEIGAGDGSVTADLLSRGYSVTATEMSSASIESMEGRFGSDENFRAVLDPGDLSALGGARFDAVLFASVLHHIPDYLTAIGNAADAHLREGGALVSIQDPLWYPRMEARTKRISDLAYMSWRLTRGELLRGVKTRMRRRISGLSEEAPGDAVEYHVVRDGVDEEAIASLLGGRFAEVETVSYWSSQGSLQQRIGERLSLENTFALFATGFQAPGVSA